MQNWFTCRPVRKSAQENKRRAARRLISEYLEKRMLLTTITAVDPAENSFSGSLATNVSATFDQDVTAATDQTFVLHRSQSGKLSGGDTTVSISGQTATHDPTDNFFAGELVQATVTSGVTTAGGAANARVWEFRAGIGGGLGTFTNSGQLIGGNKISNGVQLGDLDGDGDLDMVVANAGTTSGVYLNDGAGAFADSGQALGSAQSREVELGDLDGDGDLDAILINNGANTRWTNDGSGVFSQAQSFGGNNSQDVALGDLDADGDIDVFVANQGNPNGVYLNDGSGTLSGGASLGNSNSRGVEVGDVDGDGDLDAYVINFDQRARLWLNSGSGSFTDSGQMMGDHESNGIALGDLDGDGDLDAIVANQVNADRIWVNDGTGVFTDSGQRLKTGTGNAEDRGIDWVLGDVDADGDLDGIVGQFNGDAEHVYLNDGTGIFTDSGQRLGGVGIGVGDNTGAIAMGDVDGDGDLDLVVANTQGFNPSLAQTKVFLNDNPANQVTLSIDPASIAENGGVATVTATASAVSAGDVTVSLGISGTATASDDYTTSAAEIVIAAGSTTGSITITAVQDATDEPDETVIVDITSVAGGGTEAGTQQVTTTITDDDEPPTPDVTLSLDNSDIAEAGGVATFTITLSETTTVPVTVDLGITGTAAATDYTASATQVVVAAGATTGSITVTAIQDEVNEPDETVVVGITSVTNGNEDGDQQQTTTIVDDDVPPTFAVTSLTANGSGFQLDFTRTIDPRDINLYDTQNAGLGAADVVVTGATSGPVAGSLIVGQSSVKFVKTGDALAADTYTVTLRSAADGFKDTDGNLLDGNGDGTAGDDHSVSFTIDAVADARTIGIPDFVRGPGQEVNLPADGTTGIPITISEGDNVRAADVRIAYDPALLEITGATAPAGGSIIVNTTTTPGVAILVFFSSASLPAGASTFIELQATVPTENASANYRGQQLLDLHSVTIGDGNDNEFPVIVDDGVHFSTYFADVSGNGRVNAADAAQVARFAALIDNGFAGSFVTDPVLIGDVSGNGRVNAADASLVARFAALIPVDEIPPIPGGIAISGVPAPGNQTGAPLDMDRSDRVLQGGRADGDSADDGLGFADYSETLGVVDPTTSNPAKEIEYGNSSGEFGDLGEEGLVDEDLVHSLAIDSLGTSEL